MRIPLFATVGLLSAVSTLALAQAPPAPSTPGQRIAPSNIARPGNCTPTEIAPQESTIAPKGTTTVQGNGVQLTDRLAQTGGVLCPPAGVDPEMRAPPPGGGRTPVIPPPGSLGGDPSLRPK